MNGAPSIFSGGVAVRNGPVFTPSVSDWAGAGVASSSSRWRTPGSHRSSTSAPFAASSSGEFARSHCAGTRFNAASRTR